VTTLAADQLLLAPSQVETLKFKRSTTALRVPKSACADLSKRRVRDRAEVLRGHGRYVMAFGSKPFRAAQSKVLVKFYAHDTLRDRHGTLTRHLCPVRNASANVCELELRIVSKDLVSRHPIGEKVQYHRNPDTMPAYAGLATANVGIDRYALQQFFAGHVLRLTSTFTPRATSAVPRVRKKSA